MGFDLYTLWDLVVCYSTSFIITQAHITDFLRYRTVGEIPRLRYIYPFTSCIMCVGFWVALVFTLYFRDYIFIGALEFSVVSAVFNYMLLTVVERLER